MTPSASISSSPTLSDSERDAAAEAHIRVRALAAAADAPWAQDGPTFTEPWQAEAFALAVALHAAGRFSWSQWTAALGEALARDPSADGAGYYHAWVETLETMVARQGQVSAPDLAARRRDWALAYARTPHGAPVTLETGPVARR